MKKIIYINSTIRNEKESRTFKLANLCLEGIKDKVGIEEINISELNLLPYTQDNNPLYNPIEERFFEYSRKIANSDGVIIAAPFWDMSFPALLKVFLEKLSLMDIMFKDDGKTCVGIAKCPFMFYITTRGMDIPDGSHLEQASTYLKALCELWGIKNFDYVSIHNCDYIGENKVNELINEKAKVGIEKLITLLNK